MKCLIVDDEPAARAILHDYISEAGDLEIVGSCNDALEARRVLQQQKLDLIFLDINMPKLSGTDFLKTLSSPPQVIVTTAYSEFALEGYELDVVDYLLKPFSFERFLKALDKIQLTTIAHNADYLNLKADGKLYRIAANEILIVESNGDYLTVFTKDKKVTFNQTLREFYSQLPEKIFSRVHKSYIVTIPKIEYMEGNRLKIGGRVIPIGKSYKEEFLRKYLT